MYIGASDIPVIVMGNDYPWIKLYNRKTLWLEKSGRIGPKAPDTAMDAGRLMEASLAAYAVEQVGPLKPLIGGPRLNFEVIHPNGVMRAHPSAMFDDEPLLACFKSAGHVNPFFQRNRWGHDGDIVRSRNQCSFVSDRNQYGFPTFSDGLMPIEYWWQAQAQLSCCWAAGWENLEGVVMCVYLAGTDQPFRHVVVHADPKAVDELEAAACNFNDNTLVPDIAPDDDLLPEALAVLSLDDVTIGTVNEETLQKVKTAHYAYRQTLTMTNIAKEKLDLAVAEAFNEAGPFSKIMDAHGEWIHRKTKTTFSWKIETDD